MTTQTSPGRGVWSAPGTLYAFLSDNLPEHHTKSGILDVGAIADHLELSREGVYRCLRAGRTRPDHMRKLFALSQSESNLAALKKAKRRPPKIEDFFRFV